MKKLLHKYPNFIIGALAIIFLAVLITFYSWAINDAVAELHSALVTPAPASVTGYDLAAAAKLDYRGLININTSTSGN
ncbi:MAG TPA: hypothetical protein VIJ29_02435 [Candidatus Paceibacterota bacterium]